MELLVEDACPSLYKRKEKEGDMSCSHADHTWRSPDELWAKMKRFLPPGKPHPLGCHRPRVDDRRVMDGMPQG